MEKITNKKINLFQMERWIQMHYEIKEREKALEIAKSREFLYWFGAFYSVSVVGLLYRFVQALGTFVLKFSMKTIALHSF